MTSDTQQPALGSHPVSCSPHVPPENGRSWPMFRDFQAPLLRVWPSWAMFQDFRAPILRVWHSWPMFRDFRATVLSQVRGQVRCFFWAALGGGGGLQRSRPVRSLTRSKYSNCPVAGSVHPGQSSFFCAVLVGALCVVF